MIGSWAKRNGSAPARSLRAAFLVAGVISIGAACAPPASAELVKAELVREVTDAVGSTVKAVEAGADAVPSLPSTPAPPSPPKPPSHVAIPAVPPRASEKPPVKAQAPSPARAEAAPGSGAEPGSADPPSVDGLAGTARGAADSVIESGSEALNRVAPAERGGASTAAPRSGGAGVSQGAVGRERRTASSSQVVVRATGVAALRWLARIWPAVALGGDGSGGARAVSIVAGGLVRPALAAVAGLLLASSPILPTSVDAPLAGHHGVAGASRSAPNPAPLPAEGGSFLYLIAMAVLLALLAFTVWREFRIALHPGLR